MTRELEKRSCHNVINGLLLALLVNNIVNVVGTFTNIKDYPI